MMKEADIVNPHSERELRLATEMARDVTGKGVKIMGMQSTAKLQYFQPWQSLTDIWVMNDSSLVLQVYHEIAHWLVSSPTDRLKNNLMFGTANKFGYEVERHEVSDEKFENERLAGWAQHIIMFSQQQDPNELVRSSEGKTERNIIQYFNYLKCVGIEGGIEKFTPPPTMMNLIEAYEAARLINSERTLGFITDEDISAVIESSYQAGMR